MLGYEHLYMKMKLNEENVLILKENIYLFSDEKCKGKYYISGRCILQENL